MIGFYISCLDIGLGAWAPLFMVKTYLKCSKWENTEFSWSRKKFLWCKRDQRSIKINLFLKVWFVLQNFLFYIKYQLSHFAALSFFANVLFSSFICFKSAEIRSKLVVVFFWLSISIWRKWILMLAKPINFKPASVGPGGEGFLHWSCSPGGGRGYLNLSSPDM